MTGAKIHLCTAYLSTCMKPKGMGNSIHWRPKIITLDYFVYGVSIKILETELQ